MSDKKQCSEVVYSGPWSKASPCSRPATREFEGKMFCGIHHPNSVAKRRKKSDDIYNAVRDARRKQMLRSDAGEMGIELAKFILSPGGNSLMELCQMAHAVIDKLEGK